MKYCPCTVSIIYANLQQMFVEFCLDLHIKVLFLNFWQVLKLHKSYCSFVLPSYIRASLLWMLSSLLIQMPWGWTWLANAIRPGRLKLTNPMNMASVRSVPGDKLLVEQIGHNSFGTKISKFLSPSRYKIAWL